MRLTFDSHPVIFSEGLKSACLGAEIRLEPLFDCCSTRKALQTHPCQALLDTYRRYLLTVIS